MIHETYIYDKEEVDRYYQNIVLDISRLFFAICYNDKIIGEIQIKRIDKEKLCGTLSVHLVNNAFKGKGYGTEAQRLLIDYALNTLGLKTFYADAVQLTLNAMYFQLPNAGFIFQYYPWMGFNSDGSSNAISGDIPNVYTEEDAYSECIKLIKDIGNCETIFKK